jgi:hypothetical protein
MAVSSRLGLWAGSLVLVAACGAQSSGQAPEEEQRDARENDDCSMPFEYSSRTYTMLLGRKVGTVAPGRSLGTGQFVPCEDAGGSDDGVREVYALPGVPSRHAIVLVGIRERGSVFINAKLSATRWDADLQRLLNARAVDPPS